MNESRVLSGRYEVRELLGRGGMAEVHAGVDTRLGRKVAIKLLRSDLARDPSFHARLKREAQSAAGLNHPGIVAVYDSGEESFIESGGDEVLVPFIVMEYVEGQTLRTVLNDHGTLTVREALDVTAGVLAPLDYSHRNGIVHRDIKPGNVMLTPEGDIKVMDFGIARALEDTGSLTQTQSVVGTAQYLSPEQARGEIVDARSDLYSTACLLYELLTGRPPFVGDSQLAVAYQHVGELPKPPSAHDPSIPAAVDRLILHALEKDRDERYQDAHTFREDVLAARDGRPLSLDSGDDASTQAFPTAATMAMPPAAAGFAAGYGAAQGMGSGPDQAYAASGPGSPYTGAHQNLGEPTQAMHQPQTNSIALIDDEHEPKDEKNRSKTWIWVGTVLVLLALAAGALLVYNLNKEPQIETVQIPDLRDRNVEVAEQYLINAGFRVNREPIADDTIVKDNVVKTDPAAGQEAAKGSEVKLFVSTGPESIKVPDLEGQSEAQARQTLDNAGLKGGSNIEEDSPDVEKGTVISSKPGKDTEVEPESTVDLVVSSGRVAVPDVTGMTGDEACKELKSDKYQLGCTVKETETADHDEGKVYEQSTQSGDTVDQHATITVTVAKKPAPSPTPSPTPTDEGPFPPLPTEDDNQGDSIVPGVYPSRDPATRTRSGRLVN